MSLVDCDLHNAVPDVTALFPYLPDYWREYISQSGFKGPVDTAYPPGAPGAARPGSQPESGGPPGSDLRLIQAALDESGAEIGLLNCLYAVDSVHNPYAASALAAAVNDWQIEHWLRPEPRLRASIVVAGHFPDLAAEEVERAAGRHPGFVQVLLPVRSQSPYGNRRHFPIYEAAARRGLVIGLHFGGSPGNPPTPSGWPSYHAEEAANMAQIFQSQVLSLIVEGVFDQFPGLHVALVESGFTWMPALMWRLDKEWRGIRREVPWVKRPPSDYIREHIRLTTQPVDAPPEPAQLEEVISALGSDEMLMFASDYPHHHETPGPDGFPFSLPEPLRTRVLSQNARAFYGLERSEA